MAAQRPVGHQYVLGIDSVQYRPVGHHAFDYLLREIDNYIRPGRGTTFALAGEGLDQTRTARGHELKVSIHVAAVKDHDLASF